MTLAVTSYYSRQGNYTTVYILPCGRHTNEAAPSCCCCCTFVAACCVCCWLVISPALLGELSSLPLQLLGDRGRLRDESLVVCCVPSLLVLSGRCSEAVAGETSADSGWLLVTDAPSSSLLTSSSEEKLCLRILFGVDI